MIGLRHNSLRVAAVVIAGGLALRAADEKPATATPAEDSIAAAKRDFDSVKSAREQALQPRSDMPKMSVPDMQAGSSGGGSWTPTRPNQAEKKSANWLLEAMEKQPGNKERDRAKSDRDRPGSQETILRAADRETAPTRDERQDEADLAEDRKSSTPPVNPFSRFLETWMSRQDYALLKPGFDQPLTLGGQGSGALPSTSRGSSGLTTNITGAESLFGGAANAPKIGTAPVPRDNPYLSGLNLGGSSPAIALPAPSVAPSIPAPAISVLATPPSAPPMKTKIPEFAKPAGDEKYFKQLKRF